MNNKKASTVLAKFEQFYRECGGQCQLIETDAGTEFNNGAFKAFCEKHNIKYKFFDKKVSPNAISVVERVNRTLRDYIKSYVDRYGIKNIATDYNEIVSSYNNTKHSKTHQAPDSMTKEKEDVQANKTFYDWAFAKARQITELPKGATVNVLKKKALFGKGPSKYYSKSDYNITGNEGNKLILTGEDGSSRKAFPNELIRTNAKTISNPNANITKIKKADKQMLTKKKQKAKQTRI